MVFHSPYRTLRNLLLRHSTMKLKDKIILTVASVLVFLTIVLVLDVETYLTGSKSLFNSKVNIQPSRGSQRFVFQRHLQKTTNGSRENGSFDNRNKLDSHGDKKHLRPDGLDHPIDYDHPPEGAPQPQPRSMRVSTTTASPPDPFRDLVAVAMKVERLNQKGKRKHNHWNPNLGELLGLELS